MISKNFSYFKQLLLPVGMIAVLLLAFGLRLWRTDTFGIGNVYYSAGAVNMLASPSNFFFVVADAGGVTIDKTPIALWLQSIGVALFGVSGFAVIMPSIFASLLSTAVLYRIVATDFGRGTGLLAAFIFTTTPITIAVDHSNVADSILILTMLLSAWGVQWAIRRSEQTRRLLIAAMLMGIAFNVKMLQSFIAVPAFYMVYFFGATGNIKHRVQQLLAATVIVVMVAASWLTIVELVPKDQRPYIGSTRNNSTIELVFGYSALFRLLGSEQYYALLGEETAPPSTANSPNAETGEPNLLRFFQKELGNEMSWLLPFAFWSMGLLAISAIPTHPSSKKHQALILWGGWLVAGMVVLSSLSFLHAFYLATLTPALAALVAIGCKHLWELTQQSRYIGLSAALGALLSTLVFQVVLANNYDVPITAVVIAIVIGITLFIGASSRAWVTSNNRWQILAGGLYLLTLLLVPTLWGFTTAAERFDVTVPVAYEARDTSVIMADLAIDFAHGDLSILDIVQRNPDVFYDFVVSNQTFGAHLTMQTDLRVLYLGGFSGNDPIYSVEQVARMIEAGDIGYVLNTGHHPDIMAYVANACMLTRTIIAPYTNPQTGKISGGAILYQC